MLQKLIKAGVWSCIYKVLTLVHPKFTWQAQDQGNDFDLPAKKIHEPILHAPLLAQVKSLAIRLYFAARVGRLQHWVAFSPRTRQARGTLTLVFNGQYQFNPPDFA